MAEDEIIKHTKKTFAILKSSEHGWKHKLKETVVEILIIVFAVTLSIWLHNASEQQHNRAEEKEFLKGLKEDLEVNITHISNSQLFYQNTIKGYRYFFAIANGLPLNEDSIKTYSGIFFSSTDLDPHIGRYEGLKSSGRFSIIENKDLLNNIITLHESTIQRIKELNDKYYRHNEKLESLVAENTQLGKNGQITNAAEIVSRSDFKILLQVNAAIIANNILFANQAGITKCKEIINQINEALK